MSSRYRIYIRRKPSQLIFGVRGLRSRYIAPEKFYEFERPKAATWGNAVHCLEVKARWDNLVNGIGVDYSFIYLKRKKGKVYSRPFVTHVFRQYRVAIT